MEKGNRQLMSLLDKKDMNVVVDSTALKTTPIELRKLYLDRLEDHETRIRPSLKGKKFGTVRKIYFEWQRLGALRRARIDWNEKEIKIRRGKFTDKERNERNEQAKDNAKDDFIEKTLKMQKKKKKLSKNKVIIDARLKPKYGSKLKQIYVSTELSNKIPNRWEWTSKLDVPEKFKKKYSMLYNLQKGLDNKPKFKFIWVVIRVRRGRERKALKKLRRAFKKLEYSAAQIKFFYPRTIDIIFDAEEVMLRKRRKKVFSGYLLARIRRRKGKKAFRELQDQPNVRIVKKTVPQEQIDKFFDTINIGKEKMKQLNEEKKKQLQLNDEVKIGKIVGIVSKIEGSKVTLLVRMFGALNPVVKDVSEIEKVIRT